MTQATPNPPRDTRPTVAETIPEAEAERSIQRIANNLDFYQLRSKVFKDPLDVQSLLKLLRVGLEGTTEGPWVLGTDLSGVITNYRDERSNTTKNGWAKTICKITHASFADVSEHVRNGHHIAACSPDNIENVLDYISALQATIVTMANTHPATLNDFGGLIEGLGLAHRLQGNQGDAEQVTA